MIINPYAFGPGGPTVKWSTVNKGSNVVLSSGNTRMSKAGSGWESALGDIGHNAGLRQYELIAIATENLVLAGACNQDFASFTTFIGDSGSTSGSGSVGYHFQSGANWYEHLENNTSTNGAHGNGISTSDVLTVGVDFTGDTVKFYKNGTLVLTRSGFTSLGSKLWYPGGSSQQSSILSLRGSGLSFPIAGYTNWDS